MIKDLVLNSPSTLQAIIRLLKMETLANLTSKAWLQSCEQAAKISKKKQINESINSALLQFCHISIQQNIGDLTKQ